MASPSKGSSSAEACATTSGSAVRKSWSAGCLEQATAHRLLERLRIFIWEAVDTAADTRLPMRAGGVWRALAKPYSVPASASVSALLLLISVSSIARSSRMFRRPGGRRLGKVSTACRTMDTPCRLSSPASLSLSFRSLPASLSLPACPPACPSTPWQRFHRTVATPRASRRWLARASTASLTPGMSCRKEAHEHRALRRLSPRKNLACSTTDPARASRALQSSHLAVASARLMTASSVALRVPKMPLDINSSHNSSQKRSEPWPDLA
mmetsp:Transcript_30415/g.85961  ORF Transcript_30415/g.85961 Transcript_30415/m.85961 type:complete len:268 (+) Transcript_30415:884-1687(+)